MLPHPPPAVVAGWRASSGYATCGSSVVSECRCARPQRCGAPRRLSSGVGGRERRGEIFARQYHPHRGLAPKPDEYRNKDPTVATRRGLAAELRGRRRVFCNATRLSTPSSGPRSRTSTRVARSRASPTWLTVARGLEAGLAQHFLGLFQREFRVIGHDNRQQLGSYLREAERLRRRAFILFAVGLPGREARAARRRMPSDRAKHG